MTTSSAAVLAAGTLTTNSIIVHNNDRFIMGAVRGVVYRLGCGMWVVPEAITEKLRAYGTPCTPPLDPALTRP